jgi:hypothetical protein
MTDHNAADRLRADMARALGIDPNDPKPHESVKLAMACMLRLELDMATERQAAGDELDLGRYVLASEKLAALLDPNGPSAVVQFVTLPGEWEGPGEPPTDVTVADLRAQLAQRDAEIERLKADLTQAQSEATPQHADRPPPYITPTAGGQRVVAPATPAPSGDSAVVKMDRINAIRPPAHYLKSGQSSEPWEPYVGRFGGII